MWGASIDEAFGAGGLGLTGNGESGGGRGEGTGMGDIGGLGHGNGPGTGMGFGPGDGGFARGSAAPEARTRAARRGCVLGWSALRGDCRPK
jgi:hypothetical protein